ncbi:condensation domain-containing protein [Streptomyces sp. URMC 123]|uniref:condensation domain-containing protein n=1 Tax=Streptomyces sp. URMC 123 TaxID=3423403 RepID=UPI003F1AB36E
MPNPVIRTGPLTRAQVPIWYVDLTCPPEEKTAGIIPVVLELDKPLPVDCVRRVVDTVVDRHESLRTTYPIGPDGLPRQQVHASCGQAVEVLDMGEEGDADGCARDAVSALLAEPMDLGAAPQVRVALVARGDQVTHLCLAVHHIAADGHAVNLLKKEIRHLLDAPHQGAETLPPPVGQPLDQAADDALEPGPTRTARALAYWRDRLATMPTTVLPFRRSEHPGRHRTVTLDSPALALALPRVSVALRVPSAAVFLAALDMALTAYTGQRRWAWHSMFNARHGERQDGTVGNFARFALLDSEVDPDDSLSRLAGRVWGNTLLALRHCDYAYDDVLRHRTLDALRRGAKVELETYVNVKSDVDDAKEAERRAADRMEDLPETGITWGPGFGGALVFAAITLSEGSARFDFEVDSSVIPEGDAEKIARTVERIVREAERTGDSGLADVVRAAEGDGWPRTPEWARLGAGRWADAESTAAELARHPAVTAVRMEVRGEGESGRLRAHVTHRGALSAEELTTHLRPALLRAGVVVPDHYVLDGAGGDDEPVRGTADDGRRDALVAALHRYLPERDVDETLSPLEQDFGPLLMPAIHRDLTAAGWHGLSIESLAGLSTVRQLAHSLRREP